MIMSTVAMSEVLADSKCDRINKNFYMYKEAGGEHGKKAQEIKNKLNRNPDPGHSLGEDLPDH
jgi:hypothetical protein